MAIQWNRIWIWRCQLLIAAYPLAVVDLWPLTWIFVLFISFFFWRCWNKTVKGERQFDWLVISCQILTANRRALQPEEKETFYGQYIQMTLHFNEMKPIKISSRRLHHISIVEINLTTFKSHLISMQCIKMKSKYFDPNWTDWIHSIQWLFDFNF